MRAWSRAAGCLARQFVNEVLRLPREKMAFRCRGLLLVRKSRDVSTGRRTRYPYTQFSHRAGRDPRNLLDNLGRCGTSSSTVVMGTVVRTTVFVSGCVIGPPTFSSPLQSSFGPLPARTYTYEIYEIYEGGTPQFISTQPLVVSAAIATLSPTVLAFLVLALAAVACTCVGNHRP